MATSGDSSWTLNRLQVVTGALRKLAVLPSGGSPTAAQANDANEALNAIVKACNADGMPLWAIRSVTFNTVAGTALYNVGIGQTINTSPPLKVLQATYTPEDSATVPLEVINRKDFYDLPQLATSEGNPTQLYYQPLVSYGVLQLWPVPVDSTTGITIHYQRPFEDMDNDIDSFDFPAYWIQALIYLLAWALAPEYGIPPTDRSILSKEAAFWKGEALSYGSEEGSFRIQPYSRGH